MIANPVGGVNGILTTSEQYAQLQDKLSFIPELLQARPNSTCESKVREFNDMKGHYEMEVVTHASLTTIKPLWKLRSLLTSEQLKYFMSTSKVPVWGNLTNSGSSFAELVALFNFEGRVPLFDVLLTSLVVVEGRLP